MSGNLILNTSSPTNALQAASKGYVDNKITNSVPKVLYNGIIQAQKGVSKSVTISGLSNCKIIMGHFIILDFAVSSFTIFNNVGKIFEASQAINSNNGCSLIAFQGEKLLTSLSFHGFYFGCNNKHSETVFQYSNEIRMYCRADNGENYRISFELYKIL